MRALDVGEDARPAVSARERLRVLGAEQRVARSVEEERGRAAPRGMRHRAEVVQRDARALLHARVEERENGLRDGLRRRVAPDRAPLRELGRDLPHIGVGPVEDAARERGLMSTRHAEQERRGAGRRAPARDLGNAHVAAQILDSGHDVIPLAVAERDNRPVRQARAREVERHDRAAQREQ